MLPRPIPSRRLYRRLCRPDQRTTTSWRRLPTCHLQTIVSILAIAYNVLMDVDGVPIALREIGRVLRPTGTLVISIVHPFSDRGRFAGSERDAPFVLHDSYFGRKRFEAVEERNGLQMHFAGWSQPLENHMAALERSGFAVTALREPIPADGEAWLHMERWRRIPLFLWLKARQIAL